MSCFPSQRQKNAWSREERWNFFIIFVETFLYQARPAGGVPYWIDSGLHEIASGDDSHLGRAILLVAVDLLELDGAEYSRWLGHDTQSGGGFEESVVLLEVRLGSPVALVLVLDGLDVCEAFRELRHGVLQRLG